MDDDEQDTDEAQATLQCEMIDAARALIEEHGWTFADVEATLKATVG
jgi:hypothetical protein